VVTLGQQVLDVLRGWGFIVSNGTKPWAFKVLAAIPDKERRLLRARS
jgi:hypothetical protein